MLNPSRSLAVLAGTIALALAGCGGGGGGTSKADYQKQVQSIGNQFKNDVNQAQTSLASATTNSARAAGLEKIRVAFDKVAGKIDKLSPPTGAKDEQDKLVSVLRRGATDIGAVEKAIKNSDVSAIRSSVTKIQTDSTDAATALNNLKKAVTGK